MMRYRLHGSYTCDDYHREKREAVQSYQLAHDQYEAFLRDQHPPGRILYDNLLLQALAAEAEGLDFDDLPMLITITEQPWDEVPAFFKAILNAVADSVRGTLTLEINKKAELGLAYITERNRP